MYIIKFSSCVELLKYGSMELGHCNLSVRQPKELVYCAHDSTLSITSHCLHIVMFDNGCHTEISRSCALPCFA